ncbi:hypothetical protein [Streptomyces tirandamycinicus]|uniref:Uncharacterized protein n=1 Tax=Streptomyces tirandamycinicus TaxID=2174846 RepID=A0A2S1SP20_9ACTN|nr:hypothetical protein [Streptomyces tirandamycinicus]AWI28097.1 hypothetical protein DDW44_04300 [Streptomyces tirandamycinicus]
MRTASPRGALVLAAVAATAALLAGCGPGAQEAGDGGPAPAGTGPASPGTGSVPEAGDVDGELARMEELVNGAESAAAVADQDAASDPE